MRNDFHAEIDDLRRDLVAMGELADGMLEDALAALESPTDDLAEQVIVRDRDVDDTYSELQHRILNVIALQAPVASDLRMLSAMLHVNIHLERMGDYATNVARMAKRSATYPDTPQLTAQLIEMGELARRVGQEGLRSFAQQDTGLARQAASTDEDVDRLDIGIFHRLVEVTSTDEPHREWATRMILVARNIERYGDHGVDIGEQAIFVVTGSTVELSRDTG